MECQLHPARRRWRFRTDAAQEREGGRCQWDGEIHVAPDPDGAMSARAQTMPRQRDDLTPEAAELQARHHVRRGEAGSDDQQPFGRADPGDRRRVARIGDQSSRADRARSSSGSAGRGWPMAITVISARSTPPSESSILNRSPARVAETAAARTWRMAPSARTARAAPRRSRRRHDAPDKNRRRE